MKQIQIIVFVLITFCLIGKLSASSKAYVTDNFKITLRTGPSTQNKIIKLLRSGQLLDVIETPGKMV